MSAYVALVPQTRNRYAIEFRIQNNRIIEFWPFNNQIFFVSTLYSVISSLKSMVDFVWQIKSIPFSSPFCFLFRSKRAKWKQKQTKIAFKMNMGANGYIYIICWLLWWKNKNEIKTYTFCCGDILLGQKKQSLHTLYAQKREKKRWSKLNYAQTNTLYFKKKKTW